jgi:hypothetical protein
VKVNSTIVNDSVQAPDGTLTADRIESNTAAVAVRETYQNKAISTPANYAFTVYLKQAERSVVRVFANFIGGAGIAYATVDLSSCSILNSTFTASSCTDAGNGWVRVLGRNNSGAASSVNAGVSYVGNAFSGSVPVGEGIYIWGAQLEPGITATDYVRTVDVVGKDYRWYEPTEGTIFVEAQSGGNLLQQTISGFFTSPTSSTSRFLEQYFRANGDGGVLYSVTGGASYIESPMTVQLQGKIAGAVKLDNANAAFDGTLATLDTSVIVPTPIGAFVIGRYPSSPFYYLNGHIKRLTYWPRRLSDTALQDLTK